MEEQVLQTIQKYQLIEKNDKIVIGVSGGPDSITLLNLLFELKEKWGLLLFVAHINHGLRKEALDDEKMVETYCKKRNIPFFVKRIDVESLAKTQKESTETVRKKCKI